MEGGGRGGEGKWRLASRTPIFLFDQLRNKGSIWDPEIGMATHRRSIFDLFSWRVTFVCGEFMAAMEPISFDIRIAGRIRNFETMFRSI